MDGASHHVTGHVTGQAECSDKSSTEQTKPHHG
jgi:hypothetical protein